MRTRHRIPSIFNLSMVDVLCCALGCVILLWLVNFREAKRRAAAAGETRTALLDARGRLDAAAAESEDLRRQLTAAAEASENARSQRDALGRERDRQDKELALARDRIAALEKERRTLAADKSGVEDRLATTAATLAAATQSADALRIRLKEKDLAARNAADSADALAGRLRDAETRLKKLQGEADLIPGLKDDAQLVRTRLATAEARVQALQRDVADQMTRAEQARAAADNRFAGMALTGKRVVFLIDMSGSMEYIDEKTPAPNKWVAVRETVAKIARSLPELEKFQIVLFSDKATYLLGNDDRWLTFDPKTGVDRITQALAEVKPKGNTNMYAAFEAAFKFRAEGLDTIYLFSDGLPNAGPGLTPEAAKTMKETEQTAVLSQHIRKTLKSTWNKPQVGKDGVRINAVGFFYESPDVGAFLWALSRENDGGFVGMSKP